VDNIELSPTTIALAPLNRLYGIFRFRAGGSDRYLLFDTDNPRGVWSLRDKKVPPAFATSPAVIAGGKLWLVGGSRIQQEQTSNRLCWRDLKDGGWHEIELAVGPEPKKPMAPRMGHGVVYYKDRVWVMGGRDAAGNALDDVWTFNPNDEQPKWNRETEHAGWSPRCLISPIVFNKEIWLFGGAEEPDSDTLFTDVWHGDGERWRLWGTPGFLEEEKLAPIGGALQVIKGRLVLLGRGRTAEGKKDEETPQFFRQLDSASSRSWRPLPAGDLGDWAPYVTFACELVGWETSYPTEKGVKENSMLLALALGPNDGGDYANAKPLMFYLA
jgi:hypothetical protein